MTRTQAIQSFLADTAWTDARIVPLAQDASFRRYWRLTGSSPAVLMDAPPPEDVRPFLRIGAHLAAIGLSVPVIHKADAESGLVLEEDLGDSLLSALLDAVSSELDAGASDWDQRGARCPNPRHPRPPSRQPRPCGGDHYQHPAAIGPRDKPGDDGGGDSGGGHHPGTDAPNPAHLPDGPTQARDPTRLLHAAAEALIPIQRAAPPPGLPAWSTDAMTETAIGTLFDWWWPARHRSPAPDAARAEVAAALRATLAPLDVGPRGFVHRDYFAGNLLFLPDRPMPRTIGIIDFQGAAIGHPAYDLASLLQDARRDIPPALAMEVLDRFLSLRPELDPAEFRAAYAACAAQRHLRVACQWVRLALRDHRPQYLAYGPRTWALLTRALADPAMAPLRAALDRWVPPADRANPPGLPA